MHAQPALNRQRGVSLGGLLIICFIIGIVALLAMKVLPEYIEYGSIRKVTTAIVQDPAMKTATLADVKTSFSKRAEIDNIKIINADDLDITKEDDKLVISFSYTKKVPLFANISLLIDFEGSTSKQ
jgi:Tfp pilus assembly protein PilE